MHSATHRQTDRRHDDANSRSYCVAARSAENQGYDKPYTAVGAAIIIVTALLVGCDAAFVIAGHHAY